MRFEITPRDNVSFIINAENETEAMQKFADQFGHYIAPYFKANPLDSADKPRDFSIIQADMDEGEGSFVIGEIELQDGFVIATDPCYDSSVSCRSDNIPVEKGTYTCAASIADFGSWGFRVTKLGIYKTMTARDEMEEGIWEHVDVIGVDAGLAGFFETKQNFTDKEWSNFCNNIRTGCAWIINGTSYGVFSSSGFGDGGYEVIGHVSNKLDAGSPVIYDGLEIIFIDDEDEDDYEEEDSNDE